MPIKLTEVTDLELPELQIYRTLRDNRTTEDNSFIADSPKVVDMLLEGDIEVRSILATKEYYSSRMELLGQRGDNPTLYVAPKRVMESITGHKVHHNVMMHGIRPAPKSLDDLGDQIIMLDELSKTDNVGSIARSAAALGVESLIAPSNGPHPYGRRALRVSMGYVSRLGVHIYGDIVSTIEQLKERGYHIYGAEVTPHSAPLATIEAPEKWVLLVGHEQLGISSEILELCDERVMIEMAPDVKSFNVAIAASILMYRLLH